ncbi:MAG: SDR family oxidoreductase [Dehalococcoidia bacterium]|nr:MAG: SDR family oxidoreductase [Dehalococcoidia bacterium]
MAKPEAPLLGRIALVTGAAGRGVGHATALALARDGADVLVNTHRSGEAAEAVAEEVRSLGRRALAVAADVSVPADVDRLLATAREALGAPSILVVSAGALWKPRTLDAIPPDDWRLALGEEIDSLYLLARACLPAMRAAGWGRIVTVAGFDTEDWRVPAEDGPIDYALGKAGRHWLIRTLARQEARHGVTVNGVAPGPITRVPPDALLDALRGAHPLDAYRRPTQVDVAEAIAWLVAQPAVNGTVVSLPGPEPGAVEA